ncbi:MAG: hypothetical protein EBS84_21605, partial [Proteobacteria bacterium]|nr:hypothetical protein [Pseudomonadota bacterium]
MRPQSGGANLGAGVTFSIPQFGDFFHDMVCRVRLSGFAALPQQTPLQGTAAFPANVTDANTTVTYKIVDAFGNVLVSTANYGAAPYSVTYKNFARYCEFPGNRLFRSVKFDVNGNPLDAYDEMVPTMLEKFCTPPHKRAGYDRLVGQEVPLTGYSGLDYARVTDENYKSTPADVITRAGENQSNQTVALYQQAQLAGETGRGVPLGATGAPTVVGSAVTPLNPEGQTALFQNQYDVSRKQLFVCNGPQTPKPAQPPLEIWNKLRFWFNDDVRLAVPSVSIPFGQRFISIELCQQSALAFEFPSIFLEQTTDEQRLDRTSRRTKVYSPIYQPAGLTPISIERIELYINNIFVNPEVHDIYIKRIGFSLIRVYRQQRQAIDAGAGESLLSQLKWPIEYMFVGMRPTWNVSAANSNQWRDWHRLTRLVDATCDSAVPEPPSPAPSVVMSNYEGASVAELPFSNLSSFVDRVMPDQYYLPVPTVDSMALTSHGIVIFDNFA